MPVVVVVVVVAGAFDFAHPKVQRRKKDQVRFGGPALPAGA